MNKEMRKAFNPEEFRIKFKAFLAVMAFLAAILFLMTAMINTAAQTSKYTGTIIGFVTGTLITLIFSYYFGNSEPILSETHPRKTPKGTIDFVPGENPIVDKSEGGRYETD